MLTLHVVINLFYCVLNDFKMKLNLKLSKFNEANFNLYRNENSSTYVKNGKEFFIRYADLTETIGFLSQDTVTLDNLVIKNQIFAEATQFDTSDESFDVKLNFFKLILKLIYLFKIKFKGHSWLGF